MNQIGIFLVNLSYLFSEMVWSFMDTIPFNLHQIKELPYQIIEPNGRVVMGTRRYDEGSVISENKDLTLWIFSKFGNQRTDAIIPAVLNNVVIPNEIELFGYILFVDAQYFDTRLKGESHISPHEYVKAGIEKMHFKKETGWLYVEEATWGIQDFLQTIPVHPYVIAVTNSQSPNAMPINQLHDELGFSEKIKIIPCNPKNRDSVKSVVLGLLDVVEQSDIVLRTRQLIEKW